MIISHSYTADEKATELVQGDMLKKRLRSGSDIYFSRWVVFLSTFFKEFGKHR